MSGSLNKVILIGNLGNDPEIRNTNNVREIANFSLASLGVQAQTVRTNAIPIQQQLTSTNTLSPIEQDERISRFNQ